jgi:hypothetical protein
MPTQSITDVSITCSDEGYSVGGTVSGLTAPGLVLSAGGDTYAVPANATRFTMPAAVADGGRYAVSVRTQPAGLTCTVSRGTGTMPAGGVTEIGVTCAASHYTLGGSISGLTAAGLVLTDGVERLAVSANAIQFSMPEAFAYGSDYTVSIAAQPAGSHCQVSGAEGTVIGDVGTVQVNCAAAASR